MIATLPWNLASFIYIMLRAVIVTLLCPVCGIHPSAAQSASLGVYHIIPGQCGIADVKHLSCTAPASLRLLMGRGVKCLLGLQSGRNVGKNLCSDNWWLSNRLTERWPRCLSTWVLQFSVHGPFSNGTPRPALPPPLLPSCFFSAIFLIHFWVINFPFHPFPSFHVLFILIFQGNCLLFTDPLFFGWRDNVHGR